MGWNMKKKHVCLTAIVVPKPERKSPVVTSQPNPPPQK